LASFRSVPAILVSPCTLCALPSRIFSYNAKRSGMSSTVVSRGKRTHREAASSMAMPPLCLSQRKHVSGYRLVLLTPLALMRQEWMCGITQQH
jgi:hypothetical protein